MMKRAEIIARKRALESLQRVAVRLAAAARGKRLTIDECLALLTHVAAVRDYLDEHS